MEQVWSTATLWIGLALLASIISVRTAISVPAIRSGLAIISILLVVKVAAKFAGVWPLTRAFNFSGRDGMYTTLLMSTGLTFGSIAALYGYTNHYIDRDQYTVLVTVVIWQRGGAHHHRADVRPRVEEVEREWAERGATARLNPAAPMEEA